MNSLSPKLTSPATYLSKPSPLKISQIPSLRIREKKLTVIEKDGEITAGLWDDAVFYFCYQIDPVSSASELVKPFLLGYGSVRSANELCTAIEVATEAFERTITQKTLPCMESERGKVSLLYFLETWIGILEHRCDVPKRVIGLLVYLSEKLEAWGVRNQLKLKLVHMKNNRIAPPLWESMNFCPEEYEVLLWKSSASQIAAAIVTIETKIISNVLEDEFLHSSDSVRAPRLKSLATLFNKLSFWVATCVVDSDQGSCSSRIQKFIHIASQLRKLNDFNGMLAIISGLGNVAVQRLKKAWGGIPSKMLTKFENMSALMAPIGGYREYRQTMAVAVKPVIPYVALYLQDLVHISDGMDKYVVVENENESCGSFKALPSSLVSESEIDVDVIPFASELSLHSPELSPRVIPTGMAPKNVSSVHKRVTLAEFPERARSSSGPAVPPRVSPAGIHRLSVTSSCEVSPSQSDQDFSSQSGSPSRNTSCPGSPATLSNKLHNIQRMTQLGKRIEEFFNLINPTHSLSVPEELITAISHARTVEEDLLYDISLQVEPLRSTNVRKVVSDSLQNPESDEFIAVKKILSHDSLERDGSPSFMEKFIPRNFSRTTSDNSDWGSETQREKIMNGMIAQNISEANRNKVMSAPMSVLSQLTHDTLREHYDVKALKDRKVILDLIAKFSEDSATAIEQLFHKKVATWDTEDVCTWLRWLSFSPEDISCFNKAGIDGNGLQTLDKVQLQAIGIKKLASRKALTTEIKGLLKKGCISSIQLSGSAPRSDSKGYEILE